MRLSQPVSLRRSLSLPLLIFYGLGNILGAGIYVLIGEVVGAAGIYAPVSFIAASLLAAFTAFTYAEMSSRYPLSAGESVYIQQGFNLKNLSLAAGLLIILAGSLSSAAIIRGFVGYLDVFVQLPDALVIVALVLVLGGLAAWGINQSVLTAALITVLEIVGLLVIIWVSRGALTELPSRLPELFPPMQSGVWLGVFLGSMLAFYAYIGFEDMVNVAEEAKQPARNMPLAILIALGVSSLIYILVAVVSVLSADLVDLAASDAPLAYIFRHNTGSEPVFISIISLFAIINGALVQIIMASRVLYGLSRQGWLPSRLGRVNPRTRTPLLATLLVSILVLALALASAMAVLAEGTSFVILIVFALVNLALLRIKYRESRAGQAAGEGVFTIPLWVPAVGAVSSLGFVVFRLFNLISNS